MSVASQAGLIATQSEINTINDEITTLQGQVTTLQNNTLVKYPIISGNSNGYKNVYNASSGGAVTNLITFNNINIGTYILSVEGDVKPDSLTTNFNYIYLGLLLSNESINKPLFSILYGNIATQNISGNIINIPYSNSIILQVTLNNETLELYVSSTFNNNSGTPQAQGTALLQRLY
jgi:hypothetical protein